MKKTLFFLAAFVLAFSSLTFSQTFTSDESEIYSARNLGKVADGSYGPANLTCRTEFKWFVIKNWSRTVQMNVIINPAAFANGNAALVQTYNVTNYRAATNITIQNTNLWTVRYTNQITVTITVSNTNGALYSRHTNTSAAAAVGCHTNVGAIGCHTNYSYKNFTNYRQSTFNFNQVNGFSVPISMTIVKVTNLTTAGTAIPLYNLNAARQNWYECGAYSGPTLSTIVGSKWTNAKISVPASEAFNVRLVMPVSSIMLIKLKNTYVTNVSYGISFSVWPK